MDNFIVIEVGSTVTKSYQWVGGQIVTHPSRTILFKPHCKAGKLDDGDIAELVEFVKGHRHLTKNIFVYGTSIFRKIDGLEKVRFVDRFKKDTGCDFEIVSPDQEAMYTVTGVIGGNDYAGRVAVMVAGGGSVEILIVENKVVIEKQFADFGAVSMNERFPNLNDHRPKLTMREIDEYCTANMPDIKNKCDILVTSGGDTKYCQECMAAEYLVPNTYYADPLQPHMIKVADLCAADERFTLKQNIDVYKNFTAYQGAWWDYARGYNACIRAVAKKVGAKYEIPTRINMCIGIIKSRITG